MYFFSVYTFSDIHDPGREGEMGHTGMGGDGGWGGME